MHGAAAAAAARALGPVHAWPLVQKENGGRFSSEPERLMFNVDVIVKMTGRQVDSSLAVPKTVGWSLE